MPKQIKKEGGKNIAKGDKLSYNGSDLNFILQVCNKSKPTHTHMHRLFSY